MVDPSGPRPIWDSQNSNVSGLVMQFSLSNPLKPGARWGMQIKWKQRLQAILQLHLSNQPFYCLLTCNLLGGLMVGHDLLVWCNNNKPFPCSRFSGHLHSSVLINAWLPNRYNIELACKTGNLKGELRNKWSDTVLEQWAAIHLEVNSFMVYQLTVMCMHICDIDGPPCYKN